MLHRFGLLAALCLGCAAISGCEIDSTTSENLPPMHLAGPAISQPQPLYASAPPEAAALTPRPWTHPDTSPPPASRLPGVPASWIPRVAPNHWIWIIIHHSDSDYGSAAIIDRWHRARGFDELGYHFVIGNGTNSGDGQIEVGPRWPKQKWGAHDNALDNRYNTNGIGICLVGNFDKTRPTAAQKRSLIRLVAYLMRTYHISADHVLGHGQTKTTDCPGRYMHVAEIRSAAAELVAEETGRPQVSYTASR